MCNLCCHCDVRAKEHNETAHHTVSAIFPMANHHDANNTHPFLFFFYLITKTQCKPKVTHENTTITRHRLDYKPLSCTTCIQKYLHTLHNLYRNTLYVKNNVFESLFVTVGFRTII